MSESAARQRAPWAGSTRSRPRQIPRLLADLRKIRSRGTPATIPATAATATPARSGVSGVVRSALSVRSDMGPVAGPTGVVRALSSLRPPAGLMVEGGDPPRLPRGGLILVANNPIPGSVRLVLAGLPWQRRIRTRVLGDEEPTRLADWLAAGGVVLAFPGGPARGDGALGEFDGGAARLAARAGVPVVPVGIRGALGVPPSGSSRARVGVRFGRPLGDQAGPAEQRAAVALLLAEDARDWWRVQRTGSADAGDAGPVPGWRQTWAETAPSQRDGAQHTRRIWR